MKELRSIKTGQIHILSDKDYDKLVKMGKSKLYVVTEIKPMRSIIPYPIINKVIIKSNKTKKIMNHK